MRKFYVLAGLLLLLQAGVSAQSWMPMGPNNRNQASYGQADYTSVATAADGTIYVAFKDATKANKLTVQKYSTGTWSTVGTAGFSAEAIVYAKIAVAPDGTPYVVYQRVEGAPANGELRAVVMRFSSGSWSVIGDASLSDATQVSPTLITDYYPTVDIAIRADNTPIIVWSSYSIGGFIVRMFNGSTWVNVGMDPGTSIPASTQAWSVSFAISPTDNSLYVMFRDDQASTQWSASVMRFDGSTWSFLGPRGFSSSEIRYPSITITDDGIPYVAYQDVSTGSRVTVRVFDGANWDVVGVAGFSTGTAQNISLVAISAMLDFTPYVAYKDLTDGKATVRKFDGSNWVSAGSAGVSFGTANTVALAANPVSGMPVIVYKDDPNALKATVKELATDWTLVGSQGLSNGAGTFTSAAMRASDGQMFVAYRDNNKKATVRKYSGGNWDVVGGAGFSGGDANNLSIATSPTDGTAYVALNEETIGARVYMLAVDNTWDQMDVIGLPSSTANSVNIAVKADGVPYVAYTELVTGSERANVKMFNGASWVSVGAPNLAIATYLSFAFSPTGDPYVAYRSSTGTPAVQRFTAGAWTAVGGALSTNAATYTSLAFATDGSPYVAYNEGSPTNKLVVKRYNGTSWVAVGPAGGLSTGATSDISLKIGGDNVPYLSYSDIAAGGRLTVKKFLAGAWSNVDVASGEGFSAGAVSSTALVLSAANNPSVAFTDGFAWALTSTSEIPVPVTLVSFTAVKQNGKSRLQWQTATETNSAYFIVEHSTNGVDFNEIGRVTAQGNSNRLVNYTFAHLSPAKGNNYYRLRQVDIDNRFDVYPIRMLQFNSSELNLITLYPNPATTTLTVLNSDGGIKELIIVNMNGQQVMQQRVSSTDRQVKLNISVLPRGSYVLIANAADGRVTLPFIKQ